MPLKEYQRKRDFKKTAEPKAAVSRGQQHRFVIQKHAASHLHYDFRLELDGVLKSWAVPKQVPLKKGEKRLAVQVEDHPVGYIDFEGTIPKGQYGGGTVMVWDRGTFESANPSPSEDLAGGKLHFSLSGKKLHGEWYLVRLRGGKQWLLIRGGDDLRPISKKLDDTSALSGKTMKQLSGSDKVWQPNRPETKAIRRVTPRAARKASTNGHTKKPTPLKFIEPMKARLVDAPPAGDWIYELKFDGFRAIALKAGAEVKLVSRNEKDLAGKFPEVVESLAELAAAEAIVDGEIVALDEKGRSSFQLLQARELGEKRPPTFFYVFDLLRLNGEDMNHNFERDQEALAALTQVAVPYIGMLGPKRRQEKILKSLAADGVLVSGEFVRTLHGPVGLDIGAKTPEEIALSILAEILANSNERNAKPTRDRTSPLHVNEPALVYA